MNTRDTLICIVLISLTLYACASVAAVGGELRAAAAVQQELAAAAQGAAQRMKSAVTAAGAEGARPLGKFLKLRHGQRPVLRLRQRV